MTYIWGFGIEKEFPILIGKYNKIDLIYTTRKFLDLYIKIFIERNVKVSKNLNNKYLGVKVYLKNLIINIKNLDRKPFYINLRTFNRNFNLFSKNIYFLAKKKYQIINKLEEDFLNFYQCLTIFFNKLFGNWSEHYSFLDVYIFQKLFFLIKDLIYTFFNGSITGKVLYNNSKKTYGSFLSISLSLKNIFNEEKSKSEKQNYNFLNIISKNGNYQYSLIDLGLEKDSGGYEIRTDHYKKVTVEHSINELTEKIFSLKSYLGNILLNDNDKQKGVQIKFITDYASYYLPIIEYLNKDNNFRINLQQVYSGETELNITLPYLEYDQYLIGYGNKTICKMFRGENPLYLPKGIQDNSKIRYDEIFRIKHINLMKALRLLSPLFLAVLTGVRYFSFGDKGTIPETSFRFSQNFGYRMFTSQDLNNIYQETDFGFRSNPCINRIIQRHKLPLNDDYLQEFSVNRNNIKYNPKEGKYFGFEWKVLDQYPVQYIPHITLFVIMLAQWIDNFRLNIIDDSLSCDRFELFIEEIIFQGWNTPLNKDYFNMICDILELTNLNYNTINKDVIIDTCKNIDNPILSNLDIINLLTYHNIKEIGFNGINKYKKKLEKMERIKLIELLCSIHSVPTCYSFLQGISNHLYQHFINQTNNDSVWMINDFFPNFLSGQYKRFSRLPNINLINYNRMLEDYKKYHPIEFKKAVKLVRSNRESEDYKDYYMYKYGLKLSI